MNKPHTWMHQGEEKGERGSCCDICARPRGHRCRFDAVFCVFRERAVRVPAREKRTGLVSNAPDKTHHSLPRRVSFAARGPSSRSYRSMEPPACASLWTARGPCDLMALLVRMWSAASGLAWPPLLALAGQILVALTLQRASELATASEAHEAWTTVPDILNSLVCERAHRAPLGRDWERSLSAGRSRHGYCRPLAPWSFWVGPLGAWERRVQQLLRRRPRRTYWHPQRQLEESFRVPALESNYNCRRTQQRI